MGDDSLEHNHIKKYTISGIKNLKGLYIANYKFVNVKDVLNISFDEYLIDDRFYSNEDVKKYLKSELSEKVEHIVIDVVSLFNNSSQKYNESRFVHLENLLSYAVFDTFTDSEYSGANARRIARSYLADLLK
ncbi:MAG: hypothetical protein ACP5NV_02555 [Candidatus Woesearchaeota archaeon]